jgi:hypothetical protein
MANKDQRNRTASNKPKLSVKEKKDHWKPLKPRDAKEQELPR